MNKLLLSLLTLTATVAVAGPDHEPEMRMMHHPPGGMRMGFTPMLGIPPAVAQKLGIPPATLQRIKDLSFEANERLIPLEAELKKAHLQLDRLLSAASPEERPVMQQLEVVSRAELAVRQNRVGLMLQIRKLLGPDLWQKLEAELPAIDHDVMMFHGGPGTFHKRVKVIREARPEEQQSPQKK